jgi:hypothetical protein
MSSQSGIALGALTVTPVWFRMPCGSGSLPEPRRQTLVAILIELDYFTDPDVPVDHLRFAIGHELGEVELRGLRFDTAKEREHAADVIAADLVGPATACAAIAGCERWHKERRLPAGEVSSRTHPANVERIAHLRDRFNLTEI